MKFDARKTAWTALNKLDKENKTLKIILDELNIDETHTPKRERALFKALVYGVTRWRGRLDYILSRFSNTPLNKIDPHVINILRLALFQIIYLDRIPDSAAVNTAVELTKKAKPPWVVGYVNALLRKVSKDHHNVKFPDIKKNKVESLAADKSFPSWIIERWLSRYNLDVTSTLCDAVNSIPPITVRTNRLKTSPQKLMSAIENNVEHLKQTTYSQDGILFFNPQTTIPKFKAFKNGWFQVQDEAAQLVSLHLNPQPGETVLDACAGYGGKTGHIAQLMKNKGAILASDINPKKLLQLESEMRRLGVSIVSTQCRNLKRPFNREYYGIYDRVLIDAPCSGLGVMRRNPDIKWLNYKKDLVQFKQTQIQLIHNLAVLVKPNGILLYSVCSPEPEENEHVINDFLKNNKEFVIDYKLGQLPKKMGQLVTSKGYLKTHPDFRQMDGFFSIRLQRIS
jgi:16S rRNA (cytosine967-C5)-methyltransferase